MAPFRASEEDKERGKEISGACVFFWKKKEVITAPPVILLPVKWKGGGKGKR